MKVEIDLFGREPERTGCQFFYFATKIAYEFNQFIYISDVWDVVNGYRLLREKRGANDLERFVLGSLRNYFSR